MPSKKSKRMTQFKKELAKNAGDGDAVDVLITVPYKWKYRLTESKEAKDLTVQRYVGEDFMSSSVFNIINNRLEDELMSEEINDVKREDDISINNENINFDEIIDEENHNDNVYEEMSNEKTGVDESTILRLKEYLSFKETSEKEIKELDKKRESLFLSIKAQLKDHVKNGIKYSGMDFRDVEDDDIRELIQLNEDLNKIISSKKHVDNLTKGVQVKDDNLNELLEFFNGFFKKSTASEEDDIRQRIDSIIYKYKSAYEEKKADEMRKRQSRTSFVFDDDMDPNPRPTTGF